MSRNNPSNDTTAAIIDGALKLMVSSGAIAVMVLAPNALVALDKPFSVFLKKMDERSRERELRRITVYMKKRGLVTGSYEHGLVITKAGKRRAETADFDNLAIPKPNTWDKKWLLVLFDIPERQKRGRDYLTHKLRMLGFRPLQQSVWVYPFPCLEEIEAVTMAFGVSKYVTYIETAHIDHQNKLITKFSEVLNK